MKFMCGMVLMTAWALVQVVSAEVQSNGKPPPSSTKNVDTNNVALQVSDLPEPVQKTIRKFTQPTGPSHIVAKDFNGQNSYEVAYTQQGIHYNLLVAADGTLLGPARPAGLPLLLPFDEVETIALSEAPSVVQRVVRAEPDTSEITDIDKGKWRGQDAYELLLDKNGRPYQVIIAENGTVLYRTGQSRADSGLAIKEPAGGLAMPDLPETVQQTVKKETAGGKIRQVEKLLRNGRIIYRVEFARNGVPLECSIAEDGTVVK
jgi:uncharacterized membrane protein YkoI